MNGGRKLSYQDNEKSTQEQYDDRLKGTFVSVVSIGAFILVSWFGIFYYYISTL